MMRVSGEKIVSGIVWVPTRSCVLRFGAIMCTQMHNVSGGHLVISVIVPVYNVERWLDRCVASIVGQTYKNLEIILIDDGSTDKSSEMCDAWSRLDDRIRVVHKANGGLSSARNEGLGIAMGARIAFVDSDDWIDSEMLATMNRWMDEQSAVDVVMCGTIKNYENGREQCIDGDLPQRVFTSDQALHNFLYRSNRMASAVWNKLFDATLFKDDEGKTVVLFPEGLDNEDYYLLAHIYRKMRGIYFNPRGFYHYCIRTGSITTAGMNAHSLDKGISSERYCNYLEKSGYTDKVALAYGRMQGWYDTLYDVLNKQADGATIAYCRHRLADRASYVLSSPQVSVLRKAKIWAMIHIPRIYHSLTVLKGEQ